MAKKPRKHEGIEVRHSTTCRNAEGGRCTCAPKYRAQVWSERDHRKIRRSFSTLSEAKAWRVDGQAAIRSGALRAPTALKLADAAAAWLGGARAGAIRNRSGDRYKPSTIRGYEQALRLRLIPEFGPISVSTIGRGDLQGFVDRLMAEGHDPSTIRNTLLPLRAIFRRALARGEIGVNPTTGLELPAVRGTRDRIASPQEAVELLAAVEQDRALWATAMYAGLRLGELRALQWDAIDLDRNVIRVTWSWDPREGLVTPKSRAGLRVVPIPAVLRATILSYKVVSARRSEFVFAAISGKPFCPKSINDRADKAWKDAGLNRITLHECRHTYASFMIAAGVNAKALSDYMGHSSVMITFDRYGHLMPGNEAEAAGLLDTFLRDQEKSAKRARA
jgi:integrase